LSSPKDLFPFGGAGSSTGFSVADTGEISLRNEFLSITQGIGGELPKGIPLILRRVRVSGGESIKCSCMDLVTKEPDIDRYCPHCHGVGYLWDEIPFIGYKVIAVTSSEGGAEKVHAQIPSGDFSAPFVRFYAPWNVEIKFRDQIIQVALDTEGRPVVPLRRESFFDVLIGKDMRADNGRLEYWIAYCKTSGPKTQGRYG
jgi:hypothetical protein